MYRHVGMSNVSKRKIDVLQHINGETCIPNISKFNMMIIRPPLRSVKPKYFKIDDIQISDTYHTLIYARYVSIRTIRVSSD